MTPEKLNPYAAPEKVFRRPRIANEVIASLIAGGEIEIVECLDLAGPHLVGGKFRQRLNAEQAKRASEFGGDSLVFQSVLWWCLLFIPIRPLGVYVVLPYLDFDEKDFPKRYRAVRVDWDMWQIAVHYSFFIVFLAVILLGVLSALL